MSSDNDNFDAIEAQGLTSVHEPRSTKQKNSTIRRSRRVSIENDGKVAFAFIEKKLRSSYLFLSLDNDTISELAGEFEVVEYDPGAVIIEEGVFSDEDVAYFFIVCDGECKVEKHGKQLHGEFGKLQNGMTFGERPILFNDKERKATVVASKTSTATGSVVLYRLNGKTDGMW